MSASVAQLDPASIGNRLIALMDDLDRAFAEIDMLTSQQKQALRTLDRDRFGALAERQNVVTTRVHSLQLQQRVIARQSLPRERQHHATVTDIAMTLPEDLRQRVLDRAALLRTRAARVQRENASVGLATRSLARHMESLTQQIQTKFSAGGTYTRSNTAVVSVHRPNCLDIQT